MCTEHMMAEIVATVRRYQDAERHVSAPPIVFVMLETTNGRAELATNVPVALIHRVLKDLCAQFDGGIAVDVTVKH